MWCGFEPHMINFWKLFVANYRCFPAYYLANMLSINFFVCVYPFRHTSTHAYRLHMKHHIFTTILTYEVVKQGLTIVNPNADIVNRTRTTFLLDSLASYWNTFIPYRHAPWQHWLSPRIAFCTSRLCSATNTTKSARLGIEPTTNQLIADCSTTELHANNEGEV